MQINQVFDELYDDYTGKIIRWVPYYENMVGQIDQYLPVDFKPQNILDLGCGNGNATQVLINKYPQANYTLIDASAEMIEGCRTRFKDQQRLEYQQAFFQELNLSENHFDLIVACLSIHHLLPEEKVVFYQKIFSWLRPGGMLLTADLMIEKSDQTFHDQHLQQWKADAFEKGTTEEEWKYVMEHYEAYDFPSGLEQQQAWIKNAGFKTVNTAFRHIGWTVLTATK